MVRGKESREFVPSTWLEDISIYIYEYIIIMSEDHPFVWGCRWPYSCCFVGCDLKDFFNTAQSILVPSSFFFIRLVSVHVVHPYSSMDTSASRKICFILSGISQFYMTDSLSIIVQAIAGRVLMSFSVDEKLLPRLGNLSTSFREPPFSVEMSLL